MPDYADAAATLRPRRGHSWHPPRVASAPNIVGGELGGTYCKRAPTLRTCTAARVNAAAAAAAAGADPDGTLPARSARSAERFKDECLKLKAELSDRREETRQLQQRVRLFEGSLQVRMQQLEHLVEELRGSPEGNVGRLPDLLDRIVYEARRTQVVLHTHDDTGARLEAKDRLLQQAQHGRELADTLKDELTESQHESRRLAAKVRGSEQSCLRQKLDLARRSARKQDDLLAEYEQSHQDTHERMQALMLQLEDERRARREQERTSKRLGAQLQEARLEIVRIRLDNDSESTVRGHSDMVSPNAGVDQADGSVHNDVDMSAGGGAFRPLARAVSEATGLGLGGTTEAFVAPGGTGNSGARSLRHDLEALRDEERARRRRRRKCPREPEEEAVALDVADAPMCAPAVATTASAVVSVNSGVEEGSRLHAELQLREELAALEQRCIALEENHAQELMAGRAYCAALEDNHAQELLATEKSALAEHVASERQAGGADDVLRAEADLWEEARSAESRAWTLAEVANEVAWRADLRELQGLQEQVEMQRELRAAESRCAALAAIVNTAFAGAV